jgi:hypothetical protein
MFGDRYLFGDRHSYFTRFIPKELRTRVTYKLFDNLNCVS